MKGLGAIAGILASLAIVSVHAQQIDCGKVNISTCPSFYRDDCSSNGAFQKQNTSACLKILANKADDDPSCKNLNRDQCTPEAIQNRAALKDCPTMVSEYGGKLAPFRKKVEERKAKVKTWSSFVQQMESLRNQNSVDMCQKQLATIKKTEADIPGACQGEQGSRPGSGDAQDGDLAALLQFRACTEAKVTEIRRRILKPEGGRGTAQLHSFSKEITKIYIDANFLANEMRELTKEGTKSKCWLRDTIQTCGL